MSIENPTLAHFRHFSSLFTKFSSTSVENALQISYFLCKTNPILSAVGGLQMNLKFCKQTDYENKRNWTLGQNKPNSNPIKPNLRKAKMNVNLTLTKGYRKNDDFVVRINKPNFRNGQNERKLTYNKGLQKKRCFRSPKNKANSNPNKPNFTYPQRGKTEVRCRMSEVRYLSSAFCFCRKASCGLSSVHGPNDRNRLRLQWHFRVQKTSQKQDFVFRFGAGFVCLCKWFVFRVL